MIDRQYTLRGKRFEPPLSRDATFARIISGPNGEASFGRIGFFFTYEIPGVAEGEEASTLILTKGLYRTHRGDPLTIQVIVDAGMIVGLLGIVYSWGPL